MEKHSSYFSVSTTRENLAYSAGLLRANLPAVMYQLGDLMFPMLHEYILRDLQEVIGRDTTEAKEDVSTAFIEALHTEAYR